MLRIAIILLVWIVAYYKSDWRNWKKYQSTILFLIVGDLMINLITYRYTLWDQSSELGGDLINDLLICIFFYPPKILIYLTNYPADKGIIKKGIYISFWVLLMTSIEGFLYVFGDYHYDHGWNLLKSMLFNCVLFSILIIHFNRPLLAYALFLIGTILFIIINGIPLSSFK